MGRTRNIMLRASQVAVFFCLGHVRADLLDGLTPCADSELFCIASVSLYAGDMPSKHPSLLDTVPTITKLPTLAQTVLPVISPANTVHSTEAWKCDSMSASTASALPALSQELVYGYMVAGNSVPYCIPVPLDAADSVSDSLWTQLGYAM